MSARVHGDASAARKALHHCCGYAYRRFEKVRPRDAVEIKPLVTILAKALRDLDDRDKPPDAV